MTSGSEIRIVEDMETTPLPITTAQPTAPTRLLGIWAHPDDESYLSAGLMAQTIDAGGHVTLVTLTDGEAGFGEDDPRPAEARAALRRDELRVAMAAVGVSDIRHLGIADGEVAHVASAPVVARLARIIAEVQPDVVVTFGPDGITGHEDHIANSALSTRAWQHAGVGELWYAAESEDWLEEWRDLHDEFGVWMTDEPTGVAGDDIEFTVDLAGADLDRKRAALAGHASQTDGLAAAFGEERYRQWIAQETFRRPTAAELQACKASEPLLTAPDGCTKYYASQLSTDPYDLAAFCHPPVTRPRHDGIPIAA